MKRKIATFCMFDSQTLRRASMIYCLTQNSNLPLLRPLTLLVGYIGAKKSPTRKSHRHISNLAECNIRAITHTPNRLMNVVVPNDRPNDDREWKTMVFLAQFSTLRRANPNWHRSRENPKQTKQKKTGRNEKKNLAAQKFDYVELLFRDTSGGGG